MKTFFVFFWGGHYVFTTLSEIYLGRSHVRKSLFLAILGRRKKSLRNTALNKQSFRSFSQTFPFIYEQFLFLKIVLKT